MSLFFVDNSCDLNPQQIKSLGIECFNLPVQLEGKLMKYSQDEDFDYQKFYSKVRKGMAVINKAMTEKQYIDIFEPALNMGDDIIYVHASDNIANVAKLNSAKNKLLEKYLDRKFEIIDSKNFAAGHGGVCFKLALMYHNGSAIDEIVKESYDIKDSMAMYMVTDSLEPLSKSGVIDTNAVVGTALNIKSIVAIDIDGKMRLVEKVSGKKRALSKIVQLIRQTGKNIADNLVVISSSCPESDNKFVEEQLRSYFGDDLKLITYKMSPSNIAVVGGGTMSIAFNVHKKIH